MIGFINTFGIEETNKIKGVLLIGALHTISDEFHQIFSGDRTPAIKDVFIDSLGVLFGILIFLGIYKLNNKNKTKDNINS